MLPDAPSVAHVVSGEILAIAHELNTAGQMFRIVLAGGSTPLSVYRELSSSQADWARWEIFLGDERCLPATDPGRNSVMIREAWLDGSDIPPAQIHWIAAENGAQRAAEDYARLVSAATPFDLVLLGMGEDGHTASLFPGQVHDPQQMVVAVSNAPKPPPDRVSLNYHTLSSSRRLFVLATGAGKRQALERWRAGEALPVAGVESSAGVDVWLDKAASGNQ